MKYGSRYARRSKRRGENGSFWVSYSDLMSALVLVFILVLFYCLYQYFAMVEQATRDIEEQATQLTIQQQLLDQKSDDYMQSLDDLDEKQNELDRQQEELTQSQKDLLLQQALNEAQKNELDVLKAEYDAQKEELDAARADYMSQQDMLDYQQRLFDDQQREMAEQQEKLDKLVGVRAELIDQLVSEFSRNDITGVKVDESGAIVFDSQMMFGKGLSDLNDMGKSFLHSVVPNYLRVLMSDEYSPYVSQIIIEGHTDTDGPYDYNMRLSSARGAAVLDYILSSEFEDISEASKDKLRKIVTVNGRSFSDPIYSSDGQIDMDASRRVVIKFRLNDEQMVAEMAELLKDMP